MARCEGCGGSVKGAADVCPRCGAHAPAANSLLQLLLVSLVVAAVAATMVYLGTDPNPGKAPSPVTTTPP